MTVHDVARALPEPDDLRRRCRALALLDAVLDPGSDSPYHSFGPWGPGEEIASMRNGSGDEYDIVFGPAGVFVRGFDHESPMSPAASDALGPWPGVLDSVPEVFAGHVHEPAFSYDDGPEFTACLWRRTTDDRWHTGEIEFPPGDAPDGADHLFDLLVGDTATAYREWAQDYYEVPVDLEAVRLVLALRPLSDDLVRRLNPDLSLADLTKDITTIGYPVHPC